MTACISRTFMWHNRWDADHCPCVECEPNWAPQPKLDASVKRVTSVSLAARGRPCRTAGDDHHATSDRTHCGTWIRSDQFPVLWHHAVAAHHWTGRRRSRPRRTSEAMNTNMPRSLCRSLAVIFGLAIQCWRTDWTFIRIFGCWTASQWTGSLDLVWGRTSRSWWSIRETGGPWWLSENAVELPPVYLLWSASRLSRRVASHLAASTERRRVSAAWWTPVEKLPVQTEDKWTGTPSCWPWNADTCGQLDALAHEDRHRVCLWTPPTPDFWWLIGRTLASPSWSVEPPCDGWEWTGLSQVADLLSSWVPETTDCRNPGTSRWWHVRWPPSSTRHLRLAEGLVGCSWSGNWCFDGWAEVVAGMQCPPHPRRCRWPGSCPADSASAGQSLLGEPPPGTRQRFLAEEA